LDLDPGFQNLQLTGESVLASPLHEGHSPVENGLQILLRTAQGRTILDAFIPPGLYNEATQQGWKPIAKGANFLSESGIAGLTMVILEWENKKVPGGVVLEVKGKDGDYQLTESELPLYAQVVFDKASLATDQCVVTDFGLSSSTMNCRLQNDTGGTVICR